VRSPECSGVSGVDSHRSVPGPPQRQRSQQCVVRGRPLPGARSMDPVVRNRF